MVEMFDYRRELPEIEEAILAAVRRVLASGYLIHGPETEAFESEFAESLGARHCVAVGSGTAALHVALLGLGVGAGDEVITVANTCPPTIAAIRLTGATPVFADVDPLTSMMDPESVAARITDRTRCILPVHLWGMAAGTTSLRAMADSVDVPLLEDCAQSLGTTLGSDPTGRAGAAGCFSFYPTKNLGAYGDAGAIVTDDTELAAKLRHARMYGYAGEAVSLTDGTNARISEMQAGFLRIKLPRLEAAIARRREIAEAYRSRVNNSALHFVPIPDGCAPSYHQFVLRCDNRDAVRDHLKANGVATAIHYATPIHQMPAFERFAPAEGLPNTERCCAEVVSIPVHDALLDSEVDAVVDELNSFEA